MDILRKLSSFNPPYSDMVTVYTLCIRSILEQSCSVWHSTLTEEKNRTDLERVQKNQIRNILKEKYTNYSEALSILKLEPLNERIEWLLLKYGKKCTQLEQTKELFSLKQKPHEMKTRNSEKYEVVTANTKIYYNSTIPYFRGAFQDNLYMPV